MRPGLALAPNNAPVIENKAMAYLAQGDLDGARRFIREHSAGVDPTVPRGELRQLLRPVLGPGCRPAEPAAPAHAVAFDDRATWAIVMASTYRLQDDRRGPALMRLARYPHSKCGCAAPRTMRNLHVFRGPRARVPGTQGRGDRGG